MPARFEQEMREKGVRIYSAERFVVGNAAIPKAVRVSLISEHNPEKYEKGLRMLKESYYFSE